MEVKLAARPSPAGFLPEILLRVPGRRGKTCVQAEREVAAGGRQRGPGMRETDPGRIPRPALWSGPGGFCGRSDGVCALDLLSSLC